MYHCTSTCYALCHLPCTVVVMVSLFYKIEMLSCIVNNSDFRGYHSWYNYMQEQIKLLEYLPEVLPRPLQNHLRVVLHITTAIGSCIPQYAQACSGSSLVSVTSSSSSKVNSCSVPDTTSSSELVGLTGGSICELCV